MKLNNSCQTIQRINNEKTPNLNLDKSPKRQTYFISILKNKRIISDNINSSRSRNVYEKKGNLLINNKTNSSILLSLNKNSRNIKRKILPKIYSYKFFHKEKNRNLLHKSSNNVKSIETNNTNMESNFMSLVKESNIYTSNVKYISNIKMIILNKYKYDNNAYRPDRLKKYDMSKLPKPKPKLKKLNFKKMIFKNTPFFNYNSNIDENVFNL